MPVHDWTRVTAGTFHAFHNAWITHLQGTLNRDVSPDDYYALGEQVAGKIGPEVLTLHTGGSAEESERPPQGALALVDAPPKVSLVAQSTTEAAYYVAKARTLRIRHVSDDRVVALVEIVSPGNKHSQATVDALLNKLAGALADGFHLLVADLFPPAKHDPGGIHGLVWDYLTANEYAPPENKRLTLAAYRASSPPTAIVEPVAWGEHLAEMPLFLTPGYYVNVPLEQTCMAAYKDMPRRTRNVLEGEA